MTLPRNERRARELMARYVPANLMRGWTARGCLRIPSPSDPDIAYVYAYDRRLKVFFRQYHIANFCIAPLYNQTRCPPSDAAMAMYISITHNEDEFLATGNFFAGMYEIGRNPTGEAAAKLQALYDRQNALRQAGMTMDANDRMRKARYAQERTQRIEEMAHRAQVPQRHINPTDWTISIISGPTTLEFRFPVQSARTMTLDANGLLIMTASA